MVYEANGSFLVNGPHPMAQTVHIPRGDKRLTLIPDQAVEQGFPQKMIGASARGLKEKIEPGNQPPVGV